MYSLCAVTVWHNPYMNTSTPVIPPEFVDEHNKIKSIIKEPSQHVQDTKIAQTLSIKHC